MTAAHWSGASRASDVRPAFGFRHVLAQFVRKLRQYQQTLGQVVRTSLERFGRRRSDVNAALNKFLAA